MKTHGVIETCLYVDDLDAAEAFYPRVLGVERLAREDGRHLFYRCGQGVLLLFVPQATARAQSDTPAHGARGPGHAAFAMRAEEAEAWRAHLVEQGVEIEREIRWPGGAVSLYFRDPAGNSLELTTPGLWGLEEM